MTILYGIASVPIDDSLAIDAIPERTAGMAAQRLLRSSAGNAQRRRRRSTDDRKRGRAEESSAARICCLPTPAPCANARGRESRLRDDSRLAKIRCRQFLLDWRWGSGRLPLAR